MPSRSVDDRRERQAIGIIAPRGRDSSVIYQALSSNGIHCTIVSPQELIAGISEGFLAGAILSEEAFQSFDRVQMERAIEMQPTWSDFPLVVLTLKSRPAGLGSNGLERLGHVTLLERPLHFSALYSAAKNILRTRSRQLQIRDFLSEQQQARANLEALNSLRDLFEQAPGFIAVTSGPQHRFEMANEAYRTLVSRAVLGRTVADAFPELVSQGVLDILDGVYSSGEPFVAQELTMRLRNSAGVIEERCLSLVYQPLRGVDGRVTGLFCEGFDVTDSKFAQERIQMLQNELIQMSRLSAMGAMASTLSHELNQPLLAITNYLRACTHVLQKDGSAVSEEVAVVINKAEKSALRAGDIIRSARDLVSGNKSKAKDEKLASIVSEALELATVGETENGLICHTSYEDGIHVLVDRVQIQQVIFNIVRNALEAMTVTDERVLTVNTQRNEGMAEVMVADSGPGFNPEQRNNLFTPFITSKEAGMGLGLSISRTIIEAHGGAIGAREHANGGAIIWFTLPLAKTTSTAEVVSPLNA